MPKKIDFCPKVRAKPARVKAHWAIPASWLLEQATLHLRHSDHNVIFSSDGKNLWVYSYRTVSPPKTALSVQQGPGQELAAAMPGVLLLRGAESDGSKLWLEDWPGTEPGGG